MLLGCSHVFMTGRIGLEAWIAPVMIAAEVLFLLGFLSGLAGGSGSRFMNCSNARSSIPGLNVLQRVLKKARHWQHSLWFLDLKLLVYMLKLFETHRLRRRTQLPCTGLTSTIELWSWDVNLKILPTLQWCDWLVPCTILYHLVCWMKFEVWIGLNFEFTIIYHRW